MIVRSLWSAYARIVPFLRVRINASEHGEVFLNYAPSVLTDKHVRVLGNYYRCGSRSGGFVCFQSQRLLEAERHLSSSHVVFCHEKAGGYEL
jgi:hypothetical protein